MVYLISKRILIPILKGIFIKKVRGLENLECSDNGFIITANHTSELDSFLISTIILPFFNKKIHFFALKYLFENALLRIVLEKLAGCISVNGGVEKAIGKLGKKEIIGIFPEGRRSDDGNLQKAHSGAALLAIKTGMPILPIGIKGSFEIWSRHQMLPKLKKIVEINIGKPLYFKKSKKERVSKKILQANTKKIMKSIGKLIGKKYRY